MPGRHLKGKDFREENPPDAERVDGDIVSEWREGSDKVIERQKGAGEDVSGQTSWIG